MLLRAAMQVPHRPCVENFQVAYLCHACTATAVELNSGNIPLKLILCAIRVSAELVQELNPT